MEKISYKLAEYEGPLDLLLHLITKHKLNIYDIEISLLLQQYLGYIQSMQTRDLDIASEFLDMASRLIYIKTVSLLPKYEGEEETAKAELVGQLVEYAACKRAALELGLRASQYCVFVRPMAYLEIDMTYKGSHQITELRGGYLDAVGKGKRRLPPERSTFTPLVEKPVVSVGSRIMHIMRRMYGGAKLQLSKLFAENADHRSQLVATFLAVLELIKSGRVTIDQQDKQLTFHRVKAQSAQNQTWQEEEGGVPLAAK